MNETLAGLKVQLLQMVTIAHGFPIKLKNVVDLRAVSYNLDAVRNMHHIPTPAMTIISRHSTAV